MKITDEIINGRRLTAEDDLSFLFETDIDELCADSERIKQHFFGKKTELCTIISARGGNCSENCKFCAQSAHNKAKHEKYPFIDAERIEEACVNAEKNGLDRFSVVTAGRTLGKDFEKAVEIYKSLSKHKISLCASNGLLTEEEFRKLKESGISMYHENIETSRRNFPNICTTHTFEDKITGIKLAKKVGLKVCSGGIIGMGETMQDRVDMALELAENGVDSIPVNVLIPIEGTPLENMNSLSEKEILRSICVFRFINPTAHVRLAGGRILFDDNGRKAFKSGASAAITGDMLTTCGNKIADDIKIIREIEKSC